MQKRQHNNDIPLDKKTWLNMSQAIAYLGFGSKNTFQNWREEGVKSNGRPIFLPYHKIGKIIFYKRTDLDKFAEHFKVAE